jgi:hypothetical protein
MGLLRRTSICLAILVLGIGTCILACSDNHDPGEHATSSSGGHTSQFPSCNAIIEACHPLDVGEGPIHECHDLSEATSDAPCAAQKYRCINEVCVADAGGGSADAAGE